MAEAPTTSTGSDAGPPTTNDADSAAPSDTDSGTEATDTAAAILAKLGTCTKVSTAPYATDDDEAPTIDVCGLKNAVWWKADLDVDCDGKTTTECNAQTDPAYQDQTAATDSSDDPLDAASLPYVVVPQASSRWDYEKSGLALGTVVAVIYKGKIEYGIIGDTGPTDIIGEASYAMAKSLGIDPDPSTGGTDDGVVYVAFTGKSDAVKKNEDHAEAVTIGKARTAQFLAEN